MYSPKLRIWYEEACREQGIPGISHDKRYAIFPRGLLEKINSLEHEKTHDFCFIGAYMIDAATIKNRSWIFDFIKKHYTDASYLQFTDSKTKSQHVTMGVFDYTLKKTGFVPKEVPVSARNYYDENYYQVMCKSKFTLCPAGDANWSMRFYEALMCRSIPILLDKDCFRSDQEAILDYKYQLFGETPDYNSEWAAHNYNLFIKFHMLQDRSGSSK